jgi:hypothetical protein
MFLIIFQVIKRTIFQTHPFYIILSKTVPAGVCGEPKGFCFVFETGVSSVAQAGLKLATLLPQPPECWDNRPVLPCPTQEIFI